MQLDEILALDEGRIGALSFEEAMKALEVVVNALEREGTPLAQGITLYEQGMRLSRHCSAQLDATEARMVKILGPDREEPFDVEKDGR